MLKKFLLDKIPVFHITMSELSIVMQNISNIL